MYLVVGIGLIIVALLLGALDGAREQIRRLEHENRELTRALLGKKP